MNYPASRIPERLERIAKQEDLAYHIAEPRNRYHAFQRLVIDCDILLELYSTSNGQRENLLKKRKWYSEQMKVADAILQKRVKKKYGPLAVIRHDELGAICGYQEAIQANARKLARSITLDVYASEVRSG